MATLLEKWQAWKARRAEFLALKDQYEEAMRIMMELRSRMENKESELRNTEADLGQ